MKSQFKFFLALLLLHFLPFITINGQEITTIDNIKYYLENGEATIMVQDQGLSGDIIIPENVSYNEKIYKVVKVAPSAFNSTKIYSITLPNSITSLEDGCFGFCENLTSVKLPNDITSLGNQCFEGCGITSITLPNTITSLEYRCFAYCTNLSSIILPNSIVSLGNECFMSCWNLTSITLPNSITELGGRCFYDCSSLTSITLPNSVTELGDGCFVGCSSLTSIMLPNSITSLGDDCFCGCGSLSSITLPNSITELGVGCFQQCSSLTSITLPNSVTSLGYGCFANCNNLTSIILPVCITALGQSCFDGCTSLISIKLPNNIKLLGDLCFNGCRNLIRVDCNWTSFDGINISSSKIFYNIFSEAKLYVPKGTKEMYHAAEWTSPFKAIIEKDSEEEEKPEVKVCATPTISYSNKELVFHSETAGAEYHYSISIVDSDRATDAYSSDGKVQLTAAYKIEAWASAEGYINSEKSTATLYFIDATLEDPTGVMETNAKRGVMVTADRGVLTVSGLNEGEQVEVYNTQGSRLYQARAHKDAVQFRVNEKHGVLVIKVGKESLKVKLSNQ